MKHFAFILTFALALIAFSVHGQIGEVLVFHKSTKEYYFNKNMDLTVFTKSDGKLKGRLDSFTVKTMTITTKNNGQVTINNNDVKSFRKCGYLFIWGATHAIGWSCRRRNLKGYFPKVKTVPNH